MVNTDDLKYLGCLPGWKDHGEEIKTWGPASALARRSRYAAQRNIEETGNNYREREGQKPSPLFLPATAEGKRQSHGPVMPTALCFASRAEAAAGKEQVRGLFALALRLHGLRVLALLHAAAKRP